MFQVGDIVQVIIVPKKYKQYDITGATGIVKTVYSNNIRIHISSYYNEKSEEGDFYFKENELNNFTRKENDMSIIELWEKRSIEKIDKEAEIKLMQEFIQKKGVNKVYTCSKSPLNEIPGKRAFIKDNYDLPDDNIYFTLEKTEKLTVLQTLQQKLGLKPSQIAIVEDTVKTLDYIRAHSDFVTVHVSSFME